MTFPLGCTIIRILAALALCELPEKNWSKGVIGKVKQSKERKAGCAWKRILAITGIFLAVLFMMFSVIKDSPMLGRMSPEVTADIGMRQIFGGEEITQTFTWDRERLEGITLPLGRSEEEGRGIVTVSLQKEGTLLQEWRLTKFDIGASSTKLLLDAPVIDADGIKYTITLSAEESTQVYLYLTSNQGLNQTVYTVNGSEQPGQYLCWRGIEKNLSRTTVFAATALFAAAVFAGFILLYRRSLNRKPEWIFLFLYIAMGIFCLAAVPESRTPDEFSHFGRSYEISKGHIMSEINPEGSEGVNGAGGFLEGNLTADRHLFTGENTLYDIIDGWDQRLDEEQTQFYGYANASLYAPTSYIAQAVGIGAASLFTDRVMVLVYAGRLCNWALIGVLLFFCIRFIPVGKNLVALISLLPMNIQQFNSMSADGFAYVMVIVFLTVVMYLRFGPQGRLKKRQIVLLYVMTPLLCLCKIVYAPVCLLLFLIPRERFGTKRQYAVHVAALGALSVVSALGWLLAASRFLITFQPGVSSGEQVVFILTHPLTFLNVLLNTVEMKFPEYLFGMAGSYLGALDIFTGFLLPAVSLGVVAAAALFDNDIRSVNFSPAVRRTLAGLALMIIAVTFISLYVQWNGYRRTFIDGVQGRYFLPVLPMLLLGFKPKAYRITGAGVNMQYGYLLMAAINLCAFTAFLVQVI